VGGAIAHAAGSEVGRTPAATPPGQGGSEFRELGPQWEEELRRNHLSAVIAQQVAASG
jgi:hypothetical protein